MPRLKPGRKPMETKDKVKMVGAYLRPNEKEAINKTYGSLTNAVRTLILPTLKIN
jgi:hypothetical protein